MNLARFRPTRRHAPLFIALALAACGGGGGGAVGSVVATITGGVVPQPSPTPTPTPTPSPTTEVTTAGGGVAMPMPTATTVVSPTLAGVAPIASGLDIASNLWKAWGTGDIPPSTGDEGAFRFLCAPSHNAYDDPIVYPGQPGKSHLHTFFGNTLANANSTYASLRTTGEGSCNNLLNRSAYWVAAMMHPSGKVVMPEVIVVYYKRAAAKSSDCKPPVSQGCLGLPRGLRYVFGYNMNDPAKSDPTTMRWFNCARLNGNDAGVVSGHFATIRQAATAGCPNDALIGMAIVSPSCWNGKDLDSPDHRSHMAYMSYGDWGYARCPSTHPYLLPFFETISWYQNDASAADWKLSSDVQMGTEGGVTAHADWWGAWEDSIKDRWTKSCIDEGRSCNGGDLGDGFMLANTAKYPPSSGKPALVDAPAAPMDPGHH